MSPIVALHLTAALAALGLGTFVFTRRKGTTIHHWMGRTWMMLMVVMAMSSFWIRSTGSFSWIHLISVFVLIYIPFAIYRVRMGNVKGQMLAVKGLYGGLVVAGLFAAALPSCTLSQLLEG